MTRNSGKVNDWYICVYLASPCWCKGVYHGLSFFIVSGYMLAFVYDFIQTVVLWFHSIFNAVYISLILKKKKRRHKTRAGGWWRIVPFVWRLSRLSLQHATGLLTNQNGATFACRVYCCYISKLIPHLPLNGMHKAEMWTMCQKRHIDKFVILLQLQLNEGEDEIRVVGFNIQNEIVQKQNWTSKKILFGSLMFLCICQKGVGPK